MTVTLVRPAAVVPGGSDLIPREGWVVAIAEGAIVSVGPPSGSAPDVGAETIDLAECVVMPGLVNAHQHARGVTQVQLGFPDMILEAWQTLKQRLAWLDPAAMVPLAAIRMLASATIACIHANHPRQHRLGLRRTGGRPRPHHRRL